MHYVYWVLQHTVVKDTISYAGLSHESSGVTSNAAMQFILLWGCRRGVSRLSLKYEEDCEQRQCQLKPNMWRLICPSRSSRIRTFLRDQKVVLRSLSPLPVNGILHPPQMIQLYA